MAVAGCGEETSNSGARTVAVCFPNTTPSWQRNGDSLQRLLEEENFSVNIQFADTVDKQKGQIAEAMESRPNCMVIGAIDSASLADVLEKAKEYEIPVIAFDRIILNTDALSYYATDRRGFHEPR